LAGRLLASAKQVLSRAAADLCACVCRSGQWSADGRSGVWSGEMTRNTAGFGYAENQLTVALQDAGSSRADVGQAAVMKPVPVWLTHSTVTDSDNNTATPPQPVSCSETADRPLKF